MITSIETALVVDDDVLMREFIVETLQRAGINVIHVGNGLEAKKVLEERDADLAFVDLKMPGMGGMELLKFMKESNIPTLTVMVTAFGTVEQAVEAMKIGAYDFLMKPFSPEQVELIIKRARELVSLHAQNAYLQEELGWVLPRGRQILGQSEPMKKLMMSIKQVAKSSSTVLISGESGTGKELVALAIHSLGDRRDNPFIRMNCAAVPDTLMDSELFGHEKGAFTNAFAKRLGRFELANSGSILLDEISEMKMGLQAKLLRVLQEQEFERVGGNRTIKVDCRVMATTNRNMADIVECGEFRQDLFYRLNVLPLHIPPLRDRREDIPLLANTFLKQLRPVKNGKKTESCFTSEALEKLTEYSWPGNVRELQNLVERLSVMSTEDVLGVESLAGILRADIRQGGEQEQNTFRPDTLKLDEIERRTIMRALEMNGNNRQATADILGISVRTLRNKLNEYRAAGLFVEAA
ncbi:MAG: hypothetical protein A2283_07175 [Lentisphaerae bacterium RIFOXYA12_FULL_48_11]|nr:MAG: hypothetical protein A2283_07175 [Lentisphaerae bacterium RIFOXYA12_FULL_48_11]